MEKIAQRADRHTERLSSAFILPLDWPSSEIGVHSCPFVVSPGILPSFPLLRPRTALYSDPFNPRNIMARICYVTGRKPVKGNIINRKGQSKKSGGIGTHVTSITRRKFRPNLQRIRIKLPNGSTKRVWVSVKAIKAGLVQKA
jgi:large subunit ribosomal protein L28